MQRWILLALMLLLFLPACQPPAPPQLSAQDIVNQTSDKLKSVTSVHMTMDVQNGTMSLANMNIRSLDGDLVRPDRMHMKAKLVTLGAILDGEIITIGDQEWITNPLTKKWQKGPNVQAFTPLDPDKGISKLLANAKNLDKQADDTIDGTPVYHINGMIDGKDLSALLGNTTESKQIPAEIWIGKADMLPRQIKITGPLTEKEDQKLVRTIKLSAYNAQVTIEAPQL